MANEPDSSSAPSAVTTQRAYTLRLRRAPEACKTCRRDNCNCWRDALWATHEAINKGAKAFGDWLLTLRGGLSHELADPPAPARGKSRSSEETAALRRGRRILLALSWLSVEDEHGAPTGDVRVATGRDTSSVREQKVLSALAAILKARGVAPAEIGEPSEKGEALPGTWIGDCGPSLSAAIREDAVWVNRSAKFDEVATNWNTQAARQDAHLLLSFILSDDFLTLPTAKKANKESEAAENEDEQEECQNAVKASSRGAGQRTRHPFSHLLGAGKPFGKRQLTLCLRGQWHDYIKNILKNEVGIPILDANASRKGKRNGAAPAPTELQREMFSKAASRMAQIITKQRQQEADRLALKEADAELCTMERNNAYHDALEALRKYCDEYRVMSGATDEYMIRPRQVVAWDRVVKRWAAITETDPDRAREARINAVKEAQEADEDKKFGDANLFMRLGDEQYTSVWRNNGGADPTILERLVKGMKARSDSVRLKVAAYRHPDPYFNPVFCQFGVSRPKISFRRLNAFTGSPKGDDLREVDLLLWHPKDKCARLTRMHAVSQRLDREIGSACEQWQHNAEGLQSVSRRGRLGAAAAGLRSAAAPARVAGVFDRKRIRSRSSNDGEMESDTEGNGHGKLKEPTWNGTLSTNRRDLAAIAKLMEKGDIEKTNGRRERLRWMLTVSMELEGRGPWFGYVAAAQDKTPFLRTVRKDRLRDKDDSSKALAERNGGKRIDAEGWPWQEFNKPLKNNKDKTALVEDAKAARGDKACLILSRLPGLRVLSVDLGHRYAAACAVWEALSSKTFEAEIQGREIIAGGIGDDHLYCHTRRADAAGGQRTTIYRRIGSDKLPDGSEHPAPWARLDRQFLIKLQGEERPARAATNGTLKDGSPTDTNEVKMVAELSRGLGLRRDDADDAVGRGVDELMCRTVRIATLGLKRHGRMAKIAYAFNPDCPGIPGMGGAIEAITRGDDAHVKFILNALADWHALSTDTEWDGSAARRLWNEHVKPLPTGFEIGEPTPPDPNAERPTRQQRRKSEAELRERLKPIAEHFAGANAESTRDIHEAWAKLWADGDGSERKSLSDPAKSDFAHAPVRDRDGKVVGSRTAPKEGKESPGGWHARIRLLTDWVMGRRLPGAQSKHWYRNVGGLSLTRIATMRSLYQLHKAFAMRPRPDNVRGAPERGESNAGVAQSILDAMDHMREQRVKQIASRIVEAALGIGIERQRVWDDEKKRWRYPKRPRELLCPVGDQGTACGDPRFKACHAVVIESLRGYRPDELRTRRENRALMNWSAGKVRKYLEEACRLHGLHLREVMPNYTSRQCSRTGLPGIRCVDVAVDPSTGEPKAYWWKKALSAARKKTGGGDRNAGGDDAESRFIVALADHLAKLKAEGKPLPRSVRVPRTGGDLFVAAPPQACRIGERRPCPPCTGGRAFQADLNAAANIGLRALLDPDFPGRWWYVPCLEDKAAGTAVPRADKVKGSVCFGPDPSRPEQFGSLLKSSAGGSSDGRARSARRQKTRGSSADGKETTNFWSDPRAAAIRNAMNDGSWLPTPAYWRWVRERAIAALRFLNGLSPPAAIALEPDAEVR